MNPIIAHDLMQARVADLHRPPGRTSTGSRKHPAIWRTCWSVIALVAGAMVFLAEAPAALAVHDPHPAIPAAPNSHRRRCSRPRPAACRAGRSC